MEHLEESPTAEQVFGGMVRQARESRGWTQEDLRKRLADQQGISLEKTAMIRLESGKRPIRFNEVVALSQLLRLKLSTTAFANEDRMTEEEFAEAHERLLMLQTEITETRAQLEAVERHRSELLAQLASLTAHEHMIQGQIAHVRNYRQALEAATDALDRGVKSGREVRPDGQH